MKDTVKIPERRNILKAMAVASIAVPSAMLMASPSLAKSNTDDKFSTKMMNLINSSKTTQIADVKTFTINNGDLPWTEKMMSIKKGQQVTFFLDGVWWFSKPNNLWVEAGLAFNVRIGKGMVVNTGSNTSTITAQESGKIGIARSLSEFADPFGKLATPLTAYKKSLGMIDGIAIIWKNDAFTGLHELSAVGDVSNALFSEIQRLRYVKEIPKGWNNLFLFGASGVFEQKNDKVISCTTHKNVGILQKNVELDLSDDLTFNWKWMVEKIPSTFNENLLHTHDYLSIAIKFDDGQDLTYMWSVGMEHNTVFRCPIPGWDAIETHVVQGSGTKDLGKWLSESRDVKADYDKTIGGKAKKVVQVWLIANTIFQRGFGQCEYSDIFFKNNKMKTVVL
jgi:hypothetical protein